MADAIGIFLWDERQKSFATIFYINLTGGCRNSRQSLKQTRAIELTAHNISVLDWFSNRKMLAVAPLPPSTHTRRVTWPLRPSSIRGILIRTTDNLDCSYSRNHLQFVFAIPSKPSLGCITDHSDGEFIHRLEYFHQNKKVTFQSASIAAQSHRFFHVSVVTSINKRQKQCHRRILFLQLFSAQISTLRKLR